MWMIACASGLLAMAGLASAGVVWLFNVLRVSDPMEELRMR